MEGQEQPVAVLVQRDTAAAARIAALLSPDSPAPDSPAPDRPAPDSPAPDRPVRLEHVEDLAELGTRGGRRPDAVLLAEEGDRSPAAVGAAVRQAREAAPDAAVVVLLGQHDEALALAAAEAGAQDCLVATGLDRRRLGRSVRRAVERARALRMVRDVQERDVRAAERGRLERGLLPRPLVRDEALRCVTLYQPGLDQALLGGDFYDVVELDDGTVLALVGDVAGRGPEQAALGLRLRVAWRTLALAQLAEVDTLAALEDLLLVERQDPEAFVTACELVLEPDRTRLRVRTAGHPPPLCLRPDGIEVLPVRPAPPLGVLPWRGHAEPVEVTLGDTDGVLCYTDGLVVGLDGTPERGRLGTDGLVELARAERPHATDLGDLVTRLVGAAQARNGGPLADDVAVLALGPDERPTAAAPRR